MEFVDLNKQWLAKLDVARIHKWRRFGEDAVECYRYVKGPHRFLLDQEWLNRNVRTTDLSNNSRHTQMAFPMPEHLITVNMAAQMVQLFGPWLYDRNPVRTARAREYPATPASLFGVGVGGNLKPPPAPGQGEASQQEMMIAMQQEMAMQQYQMFLLEQQSQLDLRVAKARLFADGPRKGVLNYTPNEYNLQWHSRMAIEDGLVAGRGILLTHKKETPAGLVTVCSEWKSIFDLLVDPDATTMQGAWWIALRCVEPVWKVEKDYKLKPGTLKGNWTSQNKNAEGMVDPIYNFKKAEGRTADTLVYYKIWSRMGLGGRLEGVDSLDRQRLDLFGQHCFIVVAEGCDYPLNMPPESWQMTPEDFRVNKISWETPFYEDHSHPWPVTELDFHPIPGHLWPYGHMAPALGAQQALDFTFSTVISKVMRTCKDTILVAKHAPKEFKDAVQANEDFRIIEVDANPGEPMAGLFAVVQYAPINKDLFLASDMARQEFERATGMNDIMYGTNEKQMRSAQESQDKTSMASIRPNDMRKQCYTFMDTVARKESIAWHYHAQGKDVAPYIGQFGAQLWDRIVTGTPFGAITQELDFGVQAGSMERPDFEADQQKAEKMAQFVFPHAVGIYQTTGDPSMAQSILNTWGNMNDLPPDWNKGITLPQFTPPSMMPPMPEPAPKPAAKK